MGTTLQKLDIEPRFWFRKLMIRLVFLLQSLACGYYCLEKLLDFDVQYVPQLAFLHEQISTKRRIK